MEKLNRIKVVLVEKDMTQIELATKLGKSYSTVNSYCTNRQQPTLEILKKNCLCFIGGYEGFDFGLIIYKYGKEKNTCH